MKIRSIASIDATTDEDKLQGYLELLNEDEIPCCFTEEELDGDNFTTDEEVTAMFVKWELGLY